jgi:hypothetical protein
MNEELLALLYPESYQEVIPKELELTIIENL